MDFRLSCCSELHQILNDLVAFTYCCCSAYQISVYSRFFRCFEGRKLVFIEQVLKNEVSKASGGCVIFLLEGQDEVTAGLVQNYSGIKTGSVFC